MGMAASQARLLSITSRIADNELRAQIANNAKMRLASDSSRISADYVNALNNATMMITNYNEAGDSQFNKLTFNRLTEYSPFNTQYGLANTYGQLLVNENEAKIFEAAGGELTNYLKAHGLEHDTSYFDKASWADDDVKSEDGKYYIEFKDEFGKDIGKFELADLRAMYFGEKTSDGLNHLGFEANEDTYQTFLNKVSNFSVAYNRCQEDPVVIELIEKEISGDNGLGETKYETYRNYSIGQGGIETLSIDDEIDENGNVITYGLKSVLNNLIEDIYNISQSGEKQLNAPNSTYGNGDRYVKGATTAYWNDILSTYISTTKTDDGSIVIKRDETGKFLLNSFDTLGYEGKTINGKPYYVYKASPYNKTMQTINEYAHDQESTANWLYGRLVNANKPEDEVKMDISVGTGGTWHAGVDKIDEVDVIKTGNATINKDNTYLIKVDDSAKSVGNGWTKFCGQSDTVMRGAIPPGYVALTKNAAGQVLFLYGQISTDDAVETYADLGKRYAKFVDNYAGAGVHGDKEISGIYEIDLFGHGNGSTFEFDDTLVYVLDSDKFNNIDEDKNNELFTNMKQFKSVDKDTLAEICMQEEHVNGDLIAYKNSLLISYNYNDTDDPVANILKAHTVKEGEASVSSGSKTLKNMLVGSTLHKYLQAWVNYDKYMSLVEQEAKNYTSEQITANKADKTTLLGQYYAMQDLWSGVIGLLKDDYTDELKDSTLVQESNNANLNNAFMFDLGNGNVSYHNFAWDGEYFIVDPDESSVYHSTGGKEEMKNFVTTMYKFVTENNKTELKQLSAYTEEQMYQTLIKNICEEAFGHAAYGKDITDVNENGKTETFKENESATSGNFRYSINIMDYIKDAKDNSSNAKEAWTLKESIQKMYGIDLSELNTTDFTYIGAYKDQLETLFEAGQASGADENDQKCGKTAGAIYDNYILNCLFDIYGEPNITWVNTDPNSSGTDAEAKVKWYTNMFERMKKGYTVLEDGLARSNEWMEFALESGIATIEQVDKSNNWNGTPYSNVASITEVTDDVAVAKAEADYKKAMNEVENKDKRLDIELKNIDTEHNALQTEYESVKSVISKNVERSFKMYNA